MFEVSRTHSIAPTYPRLSPGYKIRSAPHMSAFSSLLEFRTTTTSRSGSMVCFLIEEIALFNLGMFFARVGITAKTFTIWAFRNEVSFNADSV